jgi:hypothetical protein
MENKEQRLAKVYKTKFVSHYDSKNYAEAYELIVQNPGLENCLTHPQTEEMIKFLLDKNNSALKEVNSTLKKH